MKNVKRNVIAIAIATTLVASTSAMAGLNMGVKGGFASSNTAVEPGIIDDKPKGKFAGIYVGYDYDIGGNYSLGLESGYTYASMDKITKSVPGADLSVDGSVSSFNLMLKPQVSVSIFNVYGLVGGEYQVITVNASVKPQGQPAQSGSDTKRKLAFTYGAGASVTIIGIEVGAEMRKAGDFTYTGMKLGYNF